MNSNVIRVNRYTITTVADGQNQANFTLQQELLEGNTQCVEIGYQDAYVLLAAWDAKMRSGRKYLKGQA